MSTSAQTLVNSAVSLGYDKLSERLAKECLLVAAQTGGGGGGGATAPLAGVGSPEGVQTGAPGTPYTQTDTGSIWFKKTGAGNTGWLLVIQ